MQLPRAGPPDRPGLLGCAERAPDVGQALRDRAASVVIRRFAAASGARGSRPFPRDRRRRRADLRETRASGGTRSPSCAATAPRRFLMSEPGEAELLDSLEPVCARISNALGRREAVQAR